MWCKYTHTHTKRLMWYKNTHTKRLLRKCGVKERLDLQSYLQSISFLVDTVPFVLSLWVTQYHLFFRYC